MTDKSASAELEKWVAKAVRDAIAAGHDSVWVTANVGLGAARDRKAFFFFTISTETAERARALLQDALPLCVTDLGPGYSTLQTIEAAAPAGSGQKTCWADAEGRPGICHESLPCQFHTKQIKCVRCKAVDVQAENFLCRDCAEDREP